MLRSLLRHSTSAAYLACITCGPLAILPRLQGLSVTALL